VGLAGGLRRFCSSPLPKETEQHGADEARLELPLPEETEPRRANTGAILQLAARCLQSAMALVLTTTHEAPATDMDGTDYACDGIKKQRDQRAL
jgi:hypothetical protein